MQNDLGKKYLTGLKELLCPSSMLNCKSSQDFFLLFPEKNIFCIPSPLPYVFFSYVRVQIDAISLLTDKPSKRETRRSYY